MNRSTRRFVDQARCAFILLALVLAVSSPAVAQFDTRSLSSTSAAESQAARPASAAFNLDQLQELRQQLARRRTEAGRELSEATLHQSPAWLTSSLQLEVNQLKYLELLYTQQEVLVEDRDELAERANLIDDDLATWVLRELDEQPPYSFLSLEKLRDDYLDAQARRDVFAVEIETAQELLQHAKQSKLDGERERRQLREALRSASDAVERARLERQRVNADLKCNISDSLVQLRSLENEVTTLDRRLQELRVDALSGAVEVVSAKATFKTEDLQSKLEQIELREKKIQRDLAEFQSLLALASETTAGVANTGLESTLSASKEQRDLIRHAMAQLNESLADLVIMRHVWELRFRQANGEITAKEQQQLVDQLTELQDRSKNASQVLELRLAESRQRLAQLESAGLGDANDPDSDLVRKVLGVGQSRAALLQQVDRLLDRLHGELVGESDSRTLSKGIASVFGSAKEWWGYEVIAVDDRPITIGKMVIAVLMLMGGLLVSRRASRILGNRMLPRFGIHEGASMALQTIAFYGMVTICGFLTLDMLNIPLTVFTFLGGAAAIAVGFGSQNVLNNFISGLIILGEQPIRAGDLVEIDGLHANIEHIGARSTRVRTGSNLEIIVPNSRFLENNVTNWTLSNNEIRLCVKVGVAYGSPVDRVLRLLQQSVDEEPNALHQPEPIILFNEFGDNSLNFEIHFWVRMRTIMEGRRVESAIRQRIDGLFRDHDITIAFPQRDVHLDIKRPIEISLPRTDVRSDEQQFPRAA